MHLSDEVKAQQGFSWVNITVYKYFYLHQVTYTKVLSVYYSKFQKKKVYVPKDAPIVWLNSNSLRFKCLWWPTPKEQVLKCL